MPLNSTLILLISASFFFLFSFGPFSLLESLFTTNLFLTASFCFAAELLTIRLFAPQLFLPENAGIYLGSTAQSL